MSDQAIRGLLQSRLLTAGWADQTAWEGKAFTPAAGTPYQDVSTFFATALPIGLAGSDQSRGEFQVRILWPAAGVAERGIGEAWARAEAVAAVFPRNLVLSNASGKVKISRRPTISRGPVQGDRDVTIVRVQFTDR